MQSSDSIETYGQGMNKNLVSKKEYKKTIKKCLALIIL